MSYHATLFCHVKYCTTVVVQSLDKLFWCTVCMKCRICQLSQFRILHCLFTLYVYHFLHVPYLFAMLLFLCVCAAISTEGVPHRSFHLYWQRVTIEGCVFICVWFLHCLCPFRTRLLLVSFCVGLPRVNWVSGSEFLCSEDWNYEYIIRRKLRMRSMSCSVTDSIEVPLIFFKKK